MVIAIVATRLEERTGTPPNTNTSIDFKIFEIKFECSVTFSDGSVDPENFLFDVTWYINDTEVLGSSSTKLTHAEIATTGHLREENWRGSQTLGFQVKCGIALRSDVNDPPGSVTFSELFYAGIKTDMLEYVVTEDDSFDIQVRLTVPLGCYYPANAAVGVKNDIIENQCKLTLRIQTSVDSTDVSCSAGGLTNEPISFGDNGCGLEFNHTNWENAQVVRVYGASDNQVNVENRTVTVLLRADTVVTHHNAWDSASSQNISVTVVDADIRVISSICESYNDPHMRTFDGRSWENQRLGEFVVFHNKDYWVHAMYQTCVNGVPGATCNCGVAIRNNNALFVANFCDAIIGWSVSDGVSSNQYIEGTFCDDAPMKIDNDGNTYTVKLPTGTQISFHHVTENNITLIGGIVIKPSLADWQMSSGLCGYLDGNMNNDFRTKDGGTTGDEKTFALDWKITEATGDVSLFGDITLPDQSTTLPRYCKCRGNERHGVTSAECNINTATTLCSGSGSARFFKTCAEPSRRKRSASEPQLRHKRASGGGEAVPKFPVVLDSDADSDPTPLSWRNGWDESTAKVACTQFLQDQKFLQKCEEVLENMANETAKGIKSCVKDIKLIGDSRFMQSTADTLAENCRLTAVKLENLTKTPSPAGTPGKTLLDEMLDLDCRNNCSGNGICTNRRCECTGDFEGSDCSIKRSLPPIVSSKTNPGLCQRDVYTCNTFYVSGSNFARENVTCRAVHFTIDSTTHHLTSKNETFPAVPMSGGIGCSCSLPQSRRKRRSAHASAVLANGFFLGVSNDGVAFSDNLVVIVYDSTCYTCNTTSISCIVKSSCQSTTTDLPTIPTTILEDVPHLQHGNWNTGLIVSAVIGGIGGIAVVLVLTKFVLTYKKSAAAKKEKQYSDTREDEDNYYRRNTYWEHSRGYPSFGRSPGSSRIQTRLY
ncbi:von Willebrand factor D and EGF domain-containing protein-like [Mizuhopecten yessoensis]|uniref:von Willebrand factor D and EGF domain-containing protein-like n=1 Tax=Mizuhopecten yessoensis TaxID=6573 RepID=UPI000B45D2B0|nr:von Willebrand factor D and EGF domain-containing protein-like [Mizuhopecten yessoensis]